MYSFSNLQKFWTKS